MALRLGDVVVCGEIINTRKFSTCGWIGLRGCERPLVLQLTGDCDPDLAGRHIRFQARTVERDGDSPDLSRIAWEQVGPTGTMTAARQVRVADCPPKELYARCKLGEPPPTEWKPCLYLEWFSQNGRVVIELIDPIIEHVDPDEDDAVDDASPQDAGLFDSGPDPLAGLAGDDEAGPADELPWGDQADPDQNPDDPYGLFPEDLQQEFDAQAFETDRGLGDDDSSGLIEELELMDELLENGGEGEIIGSLFETPRQFPLPDQLDDAQAEPALKALLAELALYGISLSICQHFTPRDAYRLLVEDICREQRAFPELRHTQWVQHFMTSEFCAECEAEFDREYEERERRRRDDSDDNPGR